MDKGLKCLRLLRAQTMMTRLKFVKNLGSLVHKERLMSSLYVRGFHTTTNNFGLEEFFDDRTNLDEERVKVGRPWRLDELRLKSNVDLHKLWYVLLKERNMLMTMEELHKEEETYFPSPERLYKVDESMENILDVVRERDVAVNMLNEGETGEHQPYPIRNALGIPYMRRPTEHYMPKESNKHFKHLHPGYQKWMGKYLSLYEEKLRKNERYRHMNFKKQMKILFEKFPYLTHEDIQLIKPVCFKLEEHLNLTNQLSDQNDSKH